jgi:hypothetical protein
MVPALVCIMATVALIVSDAFAGCAIACEPVHVAWDEGREADIAAYVISYQFENGQPAGSITVTAPASAAVVSDLKCGVRYLFRVSAVNREGLMGEPSDQIGTITGPGDEAPLVPPESPPPVPAPAPDPTPDPTPAPLPDPQPEPEPEPPIDNVWAFQTTVRLISDGLLDPDIQSCIFLTNAGSLTTDVLMIYLREDGSEVSRLTETIPAEFRIEADCPTPEVLSSGAAFVSVSSMEPLSIEQLPLPSFQP